MQKKHTNKVSQIKTLNEEEEEDKEEQKLETKISDDKIIKDLSCCLSFLLSHESPLNKSHDIGFEERCKKWKSELPESSELQDAEKQLLLFSS